MVDDEHLGTVKRVLTTLSPEDQRALYAFLRDRLQGKRPRRAALVASVKTKGGSMTYRQEFVRCGKAGCKCEASPCHGPYTYRYWREDGKLKKKYLGKRGYAQAP